MPLSVNRHQNNKGLLTKNISFILFEEYLNFFHHDMFWLNIFIKNTPGLNLIKIKPNPKKLKKILKKKNRDHFKLNIYFKIVNVKFQIRIK